MDLSSSVGLITGASSGIGWATAKRLAAAGAKLVVTGRRRERLDQLVGELKAEGTAHAGEITDPALPQQLIDTAIARFGRLDFVFNRAVRFMLEQPDYIVIPRLLMLPTQQTL
jgi:NADP-dependent 3-hydroxy acid dehydrogenase YdfG